MSPQPAGLGVMPGVQPPAANAQRSTAKPADAPSFEQYLQSDQAAAAKADESAAADRSRTAASDASVNEGSQGQTSAEAEDAGAAKTQRADRSQAVRTSPAAASSDAPSTGSAPADATDRLKPETLTDLAVAVDAPIADKAVAAGPEQPAAASDIAQLMASLLSMAPTKAADSPPSPPPSKTATTPASPVVNASPESSLSGRMRLNAMPTDTSVVSSPAAAEGTPAINLSASMPESAPLPTAELSLNPAILTPAASPPNTPPLATMLPASSLSAPAPGQWAEPLAERVLWMLGDTVDGQPMPDLRQARIELHPAEWGAMQIRVELNADGRTKVSFDVETPQARAAIEASLPQLRDLLGTQALHSAAPSFELSGGWSHQQRPGARRPASDSASREDSAEPVTVTPLRISRGLVDQFA